MTPSPAYAVPAVLRGMAGMLDGFAAAHAKPLSLPALRQLESMLIAFGGDLAAAADHDGAELDHDQFDEFISYIATVQNQQEPLICTP